MSVRQQRVTGELTSNTAEAFDAFLGWQAVHVAGEEVLTHVAVLPDKGEIVAATTCRARLVFRSWTSTFLQEEHELGGRNRFGTPFEGICGKPVRREFMRILRRRVNSCDFESEMYAFNGNDRSLGAFDPQAVVNSQNTREAVLTDPFLWLMRSVEVQAEEVEPVLQRPTKGIEPQAIENSSLLAPTAVQDETSMWQPSYDSSASSHCSSERKSAYLRSLASICPVASTHW